MPPKAFGKWPGVFHATQFGNVCSQESGDQVTGSENCLFLNVYAPHGRKKRSPVLPVMVWIHGGGLTGESGDIFDLCVAKYHSSGGRGLKEAVAVFAPAV